MEAKFFPAEISLSHMVKGYFMVDAVSNENTYTLLTPNGSPAIVMPFGGSFEYRVLENPNVEIDIESPLFDRPYLYGQMKTYGNDCSKGHFRLILTIFSPSGLYPFIQRDVSNFTNKVTPFHKLGLPVFESEFSRGLMSETDGNQAIRLIESEILRYINQLKEFKTKRNLDSIIQEIVENKGNIAITGLGSGLGISQRVLELEFKKQVGLSPKMLSRIVRFNNLMKNMVQKEKLDSFEFISEMGYTDQSHLIKDFLEFTGMTPMKFFKRGSEPDFDFKEHNPNW
jgi:AraC-like DNA-binding protein